MSLAIHSQESVQASQPVLHRIDARDISSVIEGCNVNLTLTSPPYFDVKDYGQDGQIGYGQDYESYLDDLTQVFSNIYQGTDEAGSLWIVIDTFRRKGELVPLPFDLAARLKAIGWCLKDVIIWKKDRTLPWISGRPARSIYEFVVVFAKNATTMKYFPDRVRDHTDLRQWWVKYPERYNPEGKAMEKVWDIPIPVQGAWGRRTPKHMCPLPPALVKRVLRLTTDPGDLVLDPFAGTGVVLSEAHRLGRRGLGCEIDPDLTEAFHSRQSATPQILEADDTGGDDADTFKETIIQLRTLKYARLLLRSIRRTLGIDGVWIYASLSERVPKRRFTVAAADYVIVADTSVNVDAILAAANDAASRRPLSKFGLDSLIRAVSPTDAFLDGLVDRVELYCYSLENSNRFKRTVLPAALLLSGAPFPVISPIGVMIDEQSDY